jgi:hypothetical protein
VLSWMSRSGYFPLENIVHVDPHATRGSNPKLAEPKQVCCSHVRASLFGQGPLQALDARVARLHGTERPRGQLLPPRVGIPAGDRLTRTRSRTRTRTLTLTLALALALGSPNPSPISCRRLRRRWRCKTRRTCGSMAHCATGHGSKRSSARFVLGSDRQITRALANPSLSRGARSLPSRFQIASRSLPRPYNNPNSKPGARALPSLPDRNLRGDAIGLGLGLVAPAATASCRS